MHRVIEPKIQEGLVRQVHEVGGADSQLSAVEVAILRTHIDESLLAGGKRHCLDPTRWKPLIMSILEFYSPRSELRESRLTKVY